MTRSNGLLIPIDPKATGCVRNLLSPARTSRSIRSPYRSVIPLMLQCNSVRLPVMCVFLVISIEKFLFRNLIALRFKRRSNLVLPLVCKATVRFAWVMRTIILVYGVQRALPSGLTVTLLFTVLSVNIGLGMPVSASIGLSSGVSRASLPPPPLGTVWLY